MNSYGSMAVFAQPQELLQAVRHVRAAGCRRLEAYAPHAVEGLAEALGSRSPRMPQAMFLAGALGATGMLALQYYAAVLDYPVRIGGRPLASWPAFIPAALEVGLLCAVLCGALLLLAGSRLPQLYHPLFHAEAFARASQDRYVLVLRSDDPRYGPNALAVLLRGYAVEQISEVPT